MHCAAALDYTSEEGMEMGDAIPEGEAHTIDANLYNATHTTPPTIANTCTGWPRGSALQIPHHTIDPYSPGRAHCACTRQ